MDKLEETILKYKSKKFLVIEPGGNNGDRLIYWGMEKKLKEFGIDYAVLQYNEVPWFPFLHKLHFGLWKRILNITEVVSKSNSGLKVAINKLDKRVYERTIKVDKICAGSSLVILIHGGGNINDLWHGIRLLRNVIQHNRNSIVIVGPQTYWFQETCFPELFQVAKREIYLFCREKYSYNLLNSMDLPENIHVHLCHDTTFYLSKEDFHPRESIYDLICLRTDKESAIFRKKGNSKGLQRIGMKGLKKPLERVLVWDISLIANFRDFLHLVEGSRKVYTDRLHVAILAALLGKDTTLYPNSYYKNKGVYEYSLFDYPNVKFVDAPKHLEEIETMLEFQSTTFDRGEI